LLVVDVEVHSLCPVMLPVYIMLITFIEHVPTLFAGIDLHAGYGGTGKDNDISKFMGGAAQYVYCI